MREQRKRMISTTVYIPEEVLDAVKALSRKTKVPAATIIRDAIVEELNKRGQIISSQEVKALTVNEPLEKELNNERRKRRRN